MQINGIILELMVHDVSTTIDFYQQALGFELVASEKDQSDKLYWAQMKFQDFLISFKDEHRVKAESTFMQTRSVGGGIAICILVNEINDLHSSFVQKFDTLDYPHLTPCGATQFSLQDNNGYVITFERFHE